jgi:hypothetical protein
MFRHFFWFRFVVSAESMLVLSGGGGGGLLNFGVFIVYDSVA